MDNSIKIICTICARGGSQGVKNKNIISFLGKPLIAHTILQAKKSQLFDYIVVSSDSKKIRDVGRRWGADYVVDRPLNLASATAAKLPAIQHAVLEIEKILSIQFDIVIDLDATSPLRLVSDLIKSLDLFLTHQDALNLITGAPARRSPYFNLVEKKKDGFVDLVRKSKSPVFRRQDVPLCYDLNASIYIWKRNALFENNSVISNRTILYVMPEERSMDIDSPFDLKIARFLARSRQDFQ